MGALSSREGGGKMRKKQYEQNVTLNGRRRDNKKTNDAMSKSGGGRELQRVFNTFYRDQVRALYRVISRSK